MVVVGSRADRNVTVWDVKTGERLHTLEMRRAVTALRFQGHRLIVALAGCLKMEEWDLKTFKKIKVGGLLGCRLSMLFCSLAFGGLGGLCVEDRCCDLRVVLTRCGSLASTCCGNQCVGWRGGQGGQWIR